MRIAALLLFLSLPVIAILCVWQGWKLLRGKPARLDRRLLDRAQGEARHIKRHFGWLAVVLAGAIFALCLATVLIPLAFESWRDFAMMIFSAGIVWGWLLQRRFGLHDA
jgi:hypothetical protein